MKLSICIPTYNREQFLPATIDSILAQWTDEVEIAISDNASTDGTEALVRRYQQQHPRIRYFRAEENRGADANYLKSVDIASGQYCWILGSDDPIAPDAIKRLLAVLSAPVPPTIVLFNRMLCNRDLVPASEDRFIDIGEQTQRRYDFGQPGVLRDYLRHASSMCVTFSYLSSMAFRKSAWDAAADHQDFVGTAYVHAYKLLKACADGAVLDYLNAALVMCRLGNDSFRAQGLARRVLLDLHGYALLAGRCFGSRQSDEALALLGVLKLEYPFARIMRYQKVLGQDPHWPEILALLHRDAGHSRAAIALATFLGKSRTLVDLSFWWRDYRQNMKQRLQEKAPR